MSNRKPWKVEPWKALYSLALVGLKQLVVRGKQLINRARVTEGSSSIVLHEVTGVTQLLRAV